MPSKPLEIKHYDSKELKMRIRGKFPHPAWVVLEELRDGTGFVSSGREADAVAFGVWPSRGFQIIGFEVKSRRSDWLSELKNPEKMEAIGQFCDQWWIVCSEAVAKLEEMPLAWGWLCPNGNGLKILKQAEKLKPLPVDRVLLMSIVRNISNNYTLLSSLEERAKEQAKSITEYKDREIERLKLTLKESENKIDNFRKISGINIEGEWKYPIERLGRAVKAVLDYDAQIKDKLKKAKENYIITKNMVESLEALSFVGFTEEEL